MDSKKSKKNILIISSISMDDFKFFDLTNELQEKENFKIYLACSKKFIKNLKDKNLIYKKFYFGPNLNEGNLKSFLFFILFPFLLISSFSFLTSLKKERIKTIICLNWNEKIIFSIPAKILKIKNIWFEIPVSDYKNISKTTKFFYTLFSKKIKIIALAELTKILIKNQILKNKKIDIDVIPFCLKYKKNKYQENIFFNLAKNENKENQRKYFTIGTITNFKKPHQIENLLKAAKICLTSIPSLQIILVGDGPERKKLLWAAKKMEIGNIVWFVGKQNYTKKWLDNFDIFLTTDENFSLANIKATLKAAFNSLPLVGFRNKGFENIIIENKNGFLIETNNSEILAQKIIKLHQDERLLKTMEKNSKKLASENFSIEKQTKELIKEF